MTKLMSDGNGRYASITTNTWTVRLAHLEGSGALELLLHTRFGVNWLARSARDIVGHAS